MSGGMLRAMLWGAMLATFLGVIMYFVGGALAAVYMQSAGSLLITAQLLRDFAFTNASTVVYGQGMQEFYTAQTVAYLFSAAGVVAGFTVGYFKGKKEDKEESQAIKTQ